MIMSKMTSKLVTASGNRVGEEEEAYFAPVART